MKRTVFILLVFLAATFIAVSFFQGNRIRELKKIQRKYEILTQNLASVSVKYKQALVNYQKIKSALDEATTNIDSLSIRLHKMNEENTALMATMDASINAMILEVDTLELNDIETIMQLRSILNGK